jgi:hypothetical protein
VQGVVQVRTPDKTAPTYGCTATRTIIGWRDDDDPVHPTAGVGTSHDLALNEAVAPFAADIAGLASSCLAGDSIELLGRTAARTRAHIREYDAVIARIWTTNLATHGAMMFGSAFKSPVADAVVEPIRAWVAPGVVLSDFREHCDFHSAALTALGDIALTIKSVLHDWREVLSAYLDDDFEPTGLSYTDRLADYPPLVRNYEDVEVVIGSEDEIEPRVYTDEDYQVWRI